ncbi:MAG: hypothetical protein K2H19_08525, partial [Ruminococcus sp.]|nr:hypothetical protein [Ruminococcus sp.]
MKYRTEFFVISSAIAVSRYTSGKINRYTRIISSITAETFDRVKSLVLSAVIFSAPVCFIFNLCRIRGLKLLLSIT